VLIVRRILLTAALVVALPVAARADEPAPSKQSAQAVAVSERLFLEGRRLAARGDHAAACPKFEEAYKLDTTAVGTLLNLALCNERIGKLASAWGQLREVATRSQSNPKRAKLAASRATALEPRLSRLTIEVTPEARGARPSLRVDGIALDEPAWGTDLPVDDDKHVIEISTESKISRTIEVEIAPERARVTSRVEALEESPRAAGAPVVEAPVAPPVASPAEPRTTPTVTATAKETAPRREPSGQRTTGIVLTVGGALAVGAGAAFGVAALDASADAGSCGSPCIAGSDAARRSDEAFDSANTLGWVSNVAVGAGVALVAAGLYLWLTAPSGARTATPRSPNAAAFSF